MRLRGDWQSAGGWRVNEKDLAVLEQYDVVVRETYRGRGFYVCVTDQGKLVLQEYKGSEKRAALQQRLLGHLQEQGYPNVDIPVSNREGLVVTTDKEGHKYLLKCWRDGRECDVSRQEDLRAAAGNLGRLHGICRMPTPEGPCADDYRELVRRHNAELRKARSFVRSKKNKNEFELYFLKYFEKFHEKGTSVYQALLESDYEALRQESAREGQYNHGNYSQHNVLFSGKEIGTVQFEHFEQDTAVSDLAYFIRKIMEKYDWEERVGHLLLEEYNRYRPLSGRELDILKLKLAYPEKFWKLTNRYLNVSKAWISGRNASKLVKLAAQETQKEFFIKKL